MMSDNCAAAGVLESHAALMASTLLPSDEDEPDADNNDDISDDVGDEDTPNRELPDDDDENEDEEEEEEDNGERRPKDWSSAVGLPVVMAGWWPPQLIQTAGGAGPGDRQRLLLNHASHQHNQMQPQHANPSQQWHLQHQPQHRRISGTAGRRSHAQSLSSHVTADYDDVGSANGD